MNTFITANIPASLSATAVKITDALGNGHSGMFSVAMLESNNIGFISSGYIRNTSPILAGRQAMIDALDGTDVTTQEIDDFLTALDLTGDDPRQRIAELEAEVDATVSAAEWVQPVGAEDAYPKGAIAKHNSKTWVSLQDANVFEPGVASWRETWGTATDTPPAWVQPTGAQDAYPRGSRITHSGDTWVSTLPNNVWEPGVTGWEKEAAGAEPWSLGGGTGAAGSYNLNDEVTHTNAQDSGNVWLFRSKIPANTTEPGTDGAFHRWWEPIERV